MRKISHMHFSARPLRSGRQGFTLTELMVVVAVAGILAAVAYPSFTAMIQRGRRADAIKALTLIVQAEERYRSNRNSYTSELTGVDGLNLDLPHVAEHYDIVVNGIGDSASLVNGYVATATPKSSSPQQSDTKCAVLSVTLDAARFSYSSVDSRQNDTSTVCWPK